MATPSTPSSGCFPAEKCTLRLGGVALMGRAPGLPAGSPVEPCDHEDQCERTDQAQRDKPVEEVETAPCRHEMPADGTREHGLGPPREQRGNAEKHHRLRLRAVL